jgi:Holliday junction resolvasome RuvABC endonuclease subunit
VRVRSASSELILGLDPGLRALGYAIVRRWRDGRIEPVALGVFRTKADASLTRSRDGGRCVRLLAEELRRLARWTPSGTSDLVTVDRACVEAFSTPPGARAPVRVALCFGAIETSAYRDGYETREAHPKTIKRAVTGNPSASKDEVRAALALRFGEPVLASLAGKIWATKAREHAADALAAAVALADPTEAKAARIRRRSSSRAGTTRRRDGRLRRAAARTTEAEGAA